MIDLEALDRILTRIEEIVELLEGQRCEWAQISVDVEGAHGTLVERIREGLWERFLEARANRPTAVAWTIRVRFEEDGRT